MFYIIYDTFTGEYDHCRPCEWPTICNLWPGRFELVNEEV